MPGESGALTPLASNAMRFASRQDARSHRPSMLLAAADQVIEWPPAKVGNLDGSHRPQVGVGQLPAPAVVLLVVVDHQNEQPNYQ